MGSTDLASRRQVAVLRRASRRDLEQAKKAKLWEILKRAKACKHATLHKRGTDASAYEFASANVYRTTTVVSLLRSADSRAAALCGVLLRLLQRGHS